MSALLERGVYLAPFVLDFGRGISEFLIFNDNFSFFSHFSISSLDLLLRPDVIPEANESLIALPSDMKFELIGGRVFAKDLHLYNQEKLLESLPKRINMDTKLRLLITFPSIGPAESFMSFIQNSKIKQTELEFFEELIMLEKQLLDFKSDEMIFLENLKRNGWILDIEQWNEDLDLELDNDLISKSLCLLL